MLTNSDFSDLFRDLNAEGVEYLVVGAHAVMFYSEPRYTKDIDIWVRPTPENAERVVRALRRFGAPLRDVTATDFATLGIVYQMGVAPNRFDILTEIEGVTWEEANREPQPSRYEGEPIRLLSKDVLIKNKLAVGRPQDLLDVERLQKT